MRKLRQRRTCLAEVTQLVELGFKSRSIRPRAWPSLTSVSASQEAGPVPHRVENEPHILLLGARSSMWGTLNVARSQRTGGHEEGADGIGQTPEGVRYLREAWKGREV